MIPWILAGLSGLAGVFYGLWQHARAARFQHDLQLANDALAVEKAFLADSTARYEKLIGSLKDNIKRLEEAASANATPDELRARLNELLRPHV